MIEIHVYISLSDYEYVGGHRIAMTATQTGDDPYQKLNQRTMEPEGRRHYGRKRQHLPLVDSADPESVGGHVLRAALDMVLLWRSSVRGEHRMVTRPPKHGEESMEEHEDLSAIPDQPTTDEPDGIAPAPGTTDEGPYQSTICAPVSSNDEMGDNPGNNDSGKSAGAGVSRRESKKETLDETDSMSCRKQNALDYGSVEDSPTDDHTGNGCDEREDNEYIMVTENLDCCEIPIVSTKP